MVSQLIILHTTKYGESSLILHCLSKEYGRKSFFVKTVGKKAPMAYFLPLNIIEVQVDETKKSQLPPVKSFASNYPLIGIRNSIYKNSIAMFIGEVLFRVLREGEYDEGLYDWVVKTIQLLDALPSNFSNFHIRFLLELAVVLGYRPTTEDLVPYMEGRLEVLAAFLNSSFQDSMLVPLSGAIRNEIAEALIRYIESHSETPIKINSLAVLRELFE